LCCVLAWPFQSAKMDQVLQIQNATEVAAWSQGHETYILLVGVPMVLGLCCCCCISWRVDIKKPPCWVKCLVQGAPSCFPMLSCCCCCYVNRYLFECQGHAGPHLALKEDQVPDTLICWTCFEETNAALDNNVVATVEQQLLLGIEQYPPQA